jgi:hypothetical protein
MTFSPPSTADDESVANRFVATLKAELGDWVRQDITHACLLWCALANVQWHYIPPDEHESLRRLRSPGDNYHAESWRSAGALVSAIYDDGAFTEYMSFYMCGPDAMVCETIFTAMAQHGFVPRQYARDARNNYRPGAVIQPIDDATAAQKVGRK